MKTIKSSNFVKSSALVLFAALGGALFVQLGASNAVKPAIAQTNVAESIDLNKWKGQKCEICYKDRTPFPEIGTFVASSDTWIVIQQKEARVDTPPRGRFMEGGRTLETRIPVSNVLKISIVLADPGVAAR